jgi:hypothetical protein
MKLKFLLVTGCLALLMGCAGTPSAENAALSDENVAAHNKTAGEKDKVVCEYVKETGSYRRVKQCRTIAQKEKQSEEARRAIADESYKTGSGGDGQ